MGEIAVNSGVEMELPVEKKNDGNITAEGSSPIVSWERFLPKMVRVMLVEADDSTRQIIAALLRKCSYRVAAVPDGLKAWELLKGRPGSIDLILTEVELPSISGYALLTLITEHDACKNIPVIMMSSHDSVSTVYKCMLRGAADFLVKPLRKNELRNLWQHVWRKQASSASAGLGPPEESVAQEKDEATAENNAVSNRSSGNISSGQRNNQFVEKGSDAQSSCTKPEIEAKVEDENHHRVSLEAAKSPTEGNSITTLQEIRKRQVCDDEFRESQIVGKMGADHTANRAVKNPQNDRVPVDTISKNNYALENSCKEAIDLIGTFDNHLRGSYGNSVSNGVINKFTALPPLDLSLRRSNPLGYLNQANEERSQLNHSNASPFSRYVNKPLQLPYSTLPSSCNSETHCPTTDSPKEIPVASIRPQQHDREISHPIPVRAVRRDNLVGAFDSVMPTIYYAKSGSSGLASPGTNRYSEPFPQLNSFYSSDCQPSTSHQFHSLVDQRHRNSTDETANKHGEKLEDQMHVSPGNDHSTNSSYCNGNMSHNQSTDSRSNGKFNAIPIIKSSSEPGNEDNLPVNQGTSHRSIQREAALTKFRLKRKDRCFEKKVRYESRKKLAEQRPRVKGQFVRQVPNNPLAGDTSTD